MFRPLLAHLREAGAAAAEIFAPHRCVQCLAAGTWLCRPCLVALAAFPRPDLACLICRQPSARGMTCRQCRHDTALTGAFGGMSFGQPAVRRAVHWLKFKGVTQMAPLLSALALPALAVIAPLPVLRREAVLVPLPLHRRRLKQRGFNQSLLLAQALAAASGIPVAEALQRRRATAPQTRLPNELRGRNVAGAFVRLPAAALAPRVLLVDDVLTTGATMMAAAAALPEAAGVREIWGVAAAR